MKFSILPKKSGMTVYCILGIVTNFASNMKRILANFFPQLISILLEIMRKPIVFWWFQGEQNLINSLDFA